MPESIAQVALLPVLAAILFVPAFATFTQTLRALHIEWFLLLWLGRSGRIIHIAALAIMPNGQPAATANAKILLTGLMHVSEALWWGRGERSQPLISFIETLHAIHGELARGVSRFFIGLSPHRRSVVGTHVFDWTPIYTDSPVRSTQEGLCEREATGLANPDIWLVNRIVLLGRRGERGFEFVGTIKNTSPIQIG